LDGAAGTGKGMISRRVQGETEDRIEEWYVKPLQAPLSPNVKLYPEVVVTFVNGSH